MLYLQKGIYPNQTRLQNDVMNMTGEIGMEIVIVVGIVDTEDLREGINPQGLIEDEEIRGEDIDNTSGERLVGCVTRYQFACKLL